MGLVLHNLSYVLSLSFKAVLSRLVAVLYYVLWVRYCLSVLVYAGLSLLVFRRKDLCEAKHDVVCVLNFAQNWTIWGGVNHTGDLGVNRTWRFEGKSSV